MKFDDEVKERIKSNSQNEALRTCTQAFTEASISARYCYNFSWLGRPIIQYPQDIVGIQELIWQVKPDLIIETGIAHGGSLILSASMLAMLDYADAITKGSSFNPVKTHRRVLGIDIDIRAHNREAIQAHPFSHRIDMIQGSSIDQNIIKEVHYIAENYKCIMVLLDSNHTHEHVLAELEAYAPLTSLNSYCVVFDTVIENLPDNSFNDRPWGRGNNPKTAVQAYLKGLEAFQSNGGKHVQFEIDKAIENKLLISVAPHGYLRRIE